MKMKKLIVFSGIISIILTIPIREVKVMKGFYKNIIVMYSLIFCLFFLASPSQCHQWYPSGLGGYWQSQYNQPYPNFSSRIGTNPFTAYNPYQNQMAFTNPSAGWQSSYFQ